MADYTVYNDGRVLRGHAKQVLEKIRKAAAADNEEIASMDVDRYAQALIEDAPYFLDARLLEVLSGEAFASDYERALAYLAQMPTSGVKILHANGA